MNKIIPSIVRKNIQQLLPYSSAREEYKGSKGVFLDANESPYGIYNRYPDPYQIALKQKIAEIKQCDPQQIFLGNGSDEVIDIAFRIFCEPNQDKAASFTPTYGMYEVLAKINAVELIQLPLNNTFQIDVKSLLPYLSDKNLKLIFICSPNNPTGNLLKEESITFILENFNGIVFIDEAYIDFSTQNSFFKKLNKYPNLIVSQTLSKAWGMAGIRLGIAYMNEEIIAYYNKVKPPYNISAINQETALKVLSDTGKFEWQVMEIISEKANLLEALKRLKIVKKIYPTDANFVLIKVEDANKIYNYLTDHQVIIRNRTSVVKNCVRITVGTKIENQQLLNALKQIDNG